MLMLRRTGETGERQEKGQRGLPSPRGRETFSRTRGISRNGGSRSERNDRDTIDDRHKKEDRDQRRGTQKTDLRADRLERTTPTPIWRGIPRLHDGNRILRELGKHMKGRPKGKNGDGKGDKGTQRIQKPLNRFKDYSYFCI